MTLSDIAALLWCAIPVVLVLVGIGLWAFWQHVNVWIDEQFGDEPGRME